MDKNPKKKNKETPPLDPDSRLKIRVVAITSSLSAFKVLIKWAGIVLVVRYGFLSIEALSGKTTQSNILLNLMTDFKADQVFAYLFGGGGLFYGKLQNKEKKRVILNNTKRIHELESRIDPNRTSSGLTETGDTRPEDEL